MNQTRAQWLIANTGRFDELRWSFESPLLKPPFHTGEVSSFQFFEDGITMEEFEFVKMIWSLMSEKSSFYDAVAKIAIGI